MSESTMNVAHTDGHVRKNSQSSNGQHDAYKNGQKYANGVSINMKNDSKSIHCHSSKSAKDKNKIAFIKLTIAFILCFLFMIAEIVGGVIASSIAIQTDAAHMASDLAGYFFSILAIYLSRKRENVFLKILFI